MNTTFQIQQFEDKPLSHYSYAILSNKEMSIVDPARDISVYLDFAKDQNASIKYVIETHPHADFVSGHLDIHEQTGATILVSKLVAADYPHETFDESDHVRLGNVVLKAFNTPGHSPDSISVILQEDNIDRAVFSGDTLFIGDCGRPDLRESGNDVKSSRETLASQMYHSLRDKFIHLADEVILYPAHGAGTLCGKNLSSANSSTMGAEKNSNWSLQKQDEPTFLKELLADQPFIPAYFSYNVSLNKKGATGWDQSIGSVQFLKEIKDNLDTIIIDTRDSERFANGHMPNSYNLQEGGKFETWLGSIIQPEEPFYLAAVSEEKGLELVKRVAKIGYESQLKGYFVPDILSEITPRIDAAEIADNLEDYTIVDIRNKAEVKDKPIFKNALNIPLADLRKDFKNIPTDKPIVVHCAGGYRSAAGSSILANYIQTVPVYDFGEAIKDYQ